MGPFTGKNKVIKNLFTSSKAEPIPLRRLFQKFAVPKRKIANNESNYASFHDYLRRIVDYSLFEMNGEIYVASRHYPTFLYASLLLLHKEPGYQVDATLCQELGKVPSELRSFTVNKVTVDEDLISSFRTKWISSGCLDPTTGALNREQMQVMLSKHEAVHQISALRKMRLSDSAIPEFRSGMSVAESTQEGANPSVQQTMDESRTPKVPSSEDDFVAISCCGDYLAFRSFAECTTFDLNRSTDLALEHVQSLHEKKRVVCHDVLSLAQPVRDMLGKRQNEGVVDLQLGMEFVCGDPLNSLAQVVRRCVGAKAGDLVLQNDEALKALRRTNTIDANQELVRRLEENAWLLWTAGRTAANTDMIEAVTHLRLCLGRRELTFDLDNNYSLASQQLLLQARPNSAFMADSVQIHNDMESLLNLLPQQLRRSIEGTDMADLMEIYLDKNRPPTCRSIEEERRVLSDLPSISQADLDEVMAAVGHFGSDNRAGLEGELHRISCMRNRDNKVYSLTLRVGRYVTGLADIVSDMMYQTNKSILVLSEPGCGKTTFVREITRRLAERRAVCIVDTSNEIAGDGDTPHSCVGSARRLMVPDLHRQADIMIECVQNHTPQVIVVDEIGRPREVESARTCKHRGVRMVASAHGNLRSLVSNGQLSGLVGGKERVVLGDETAREEKKRKHSQDMEKVRVQRMAAPIFEIIVELTPLNHDQYDVVADAGAAVDAILDGRMYECERRTRNENGTFGVEDVEK